MKKKITVALVILCIIAATLPVSRAATPYFTAVDDTLLPFSDSTMPAYHNGILYVPYRVFQNAQVYSFRSVEDGILRLYRGNRSVDFFVFQGTAINQDGQNEAASAREENGTIYIPLDFVCRYFDLTYNIIELDESSVVTLAPMAIIRIKSPAVITNDKTFVGMTKKQMQTVYNEYYGIVPTAPATPSPPVLPPVDPAVPKYSNVTLYFSLFGLPSGYASELVDMLAEQDFRCSIYVTEYDILLNPGLIRRFYSAGHSIGIWLSEGSFTEYQRTAAILFEATKAPTLLIAADDAADTARQTAAEHGLIFRSASGTYADEEESLTADIITTRLPVNSGARYDLRLVCAENVAEVLPEVIDYLLLHEYKISNITETTAPVN